MFLARRGAMGNPPIGKNRFSNKAITGNYWKSPDESNIAIGKSFNRGLSWGD